MAAQLINIRNRKMRRIHPILIRTQRRIRVDPLLQRHATATEDLELSCNLGKFGELKSSAIPIKSSTTIDKKEKGKDEVSIHDWNVKCNVFSLQGHKFADFEPCQSWEQQHRMKQSFPSLEILIGTNAYFANLDNAPPEMLSDLNI